MRKVVAERSWFSSVDIGSIRLNAKSRDDIPAILTDEATREELFRLHSAIGNRPSDEAEAAFREQQCGVEKAA